MKKTRLGAAGWLAAFFIAASAWGSFVPEYMSYEGAVLDETGQPGSGTRTFLFMLYDTNNLLRWVEEIKDVPLNQQGAFSVLLGKTHPLPSIDPSWRLTITVKSDNAPGMEIANSQAMSSVFYALQADDARRASGHFAVQQDLSVTGELSAQGPLSATWLSAEDITATSLSVINLVVSDVSGTTNSPVSIDGELEIARGLVLKGSVSMMTVEDLNYSTIQSLSGRYYVLAIPRDNLNLNHIVVTTSGARKTHYSNMPNGIYFLPLSLNPGDRIQFYDKRGDEIAVGSWSFTQIFRTIKLIRMHR